MARPRQARSVETRSRLLTAAAAIIAEHGIEGASVDAIAERAERTSGSLYGQFGSKDGLIVELLDRSKDVVAQSMFVDIEAAATLDERLAAMWRNFAEPPPAARDWVRFEHEVWVWANRPGNDEAKARLATRYRTEFAALATALADWAGEGLIAPPGPIDRVATVVVSTLLGLEMSYRLDPSAIDDASVVTALRGILRACDGPDSSDSSDDAGTPVPTTFTRSAEGDILMKLQDINLLAETWEHAVPHEQFDLLRREAPVFRHPEPSGPGFWAVTRHADVVAVSRDSATWSSELGGTFIDDQTDEALAQIRLTILNMDPPKHHRYRRLVSRGFTPRMVAKLVETIEKRAERIVDDVIDRGSCDFVEDVAVKLPLEMICEMIGLPEADWDRLFELSNLLVGFDDPEYRADPEAGTLAAAEIYAYCDAVAADRRANPRDDLMTALVQAEVDGERLDDLELNLFFVTLVVAGNETTRNLITHSMQALIDHPDQAQRLRDDPGLWPTAVEEMLRWGCSIHNFRRTATRDAELAGQPIAAGDKVVLYYMAANRDPEVFDDPYRFDVGRTPNDHVAFGGGGEHYCLGANLARAEITAIMRQVVDRLDAVEPAGEVRRLRSSFVNGVKEMPISYRAR